MNTARLLVGVTGLTFSMAGHAATFELVSASWDTARAAGGRQVAISSNGRYVVFESESAKVVSGDTNGVSDIFLRDRVTGKTLRVSVSSTGAQANGPSVAPLGSVTPDGHFVSFVSSASNLVAGDTNGVDDVFVRDTVAGTTERVSVSSSGVQGNKPSWAAILSHDGRFVLFNSEASNFFVSETWAPTVYVRDRLNRTTLVAGLDDRTVRCALGGFSADGNLAAFTCGYWSEIFVRNLTDGTVERVSTFPHTVENVTSVQALSADGRYLVFTTDAVVVRADTNGGLGSYDAYLYDRTTKAFELISVTKSGVSGNNSSGATSVSDDGRFVAFGSWAKDLVENDLGNSFDGFVRDRTSKTTKRVTVSSLGGCCSIWGALISGDGSTGLFTSDTKFAANDSNDRDDVFVATNLFDTSGSFTVQPRILTFGAVPVGSTSPAQTVTIKNTGASGLPIAWVGLAGADAAEFARVRNCPDVLPAGQQCSATVSFTPHTAGSQEARLVVSAGGRRKSATVSGVAE